MVRVRYGTAACDAVLTVALGTIPASAGSTDAETQGLITAWGPSPRARGARFRGLCVFVPGGTIPACAGSTVNDLRLHCTERPISFTSRETDKPPTRAGRIAAANGQPNRYPPTPHKAKSRPLVAGYAEGFDDDGRRYLIAALTTHSAGSASTQSAPLRWPRTAHRRRDGSSCVVAEQLLHRVRCGPTCAWEGWCFYTGARRTHGVPDRTGSGVGHSYSSLRACCYGGGQITKNVVNFLPAAMMPLSCLLTPN